MNSDLNPEPEAAMATLRQQFPGRLNVLFVAIHVIDNQDALAQDLAAAHDGGADGIFLIKDYAAPFEIRTDDRGVLAAYEFARNKYGPWWMGLNLLDHTADQAVSVIKDGVQGLWFDHAHVQEGPPGNASFLKEVRGVQQVWRSHTRLFPSLAMKYQHRVKNYTAVVKLAQDYADAIVTSGEKTGTPPELAKIQEMVRATRLPVGSASGMSPENVQPFLDAGMYFVIANTHLSDNNTKRLLPRRVEAMRKCFS